MASSPEAVSKNRYQPLPSLTKEIDMTLMAPVLALFAENPNEIGCVSVYLSYQSFSLRA